MLYLDSNRDSVKKDWRELASQSVHSINSLNSNYSIMKENNSIINDSIGNLKESIKKDIKLIKNANPLNNKKISLNDHKTMGNVLIKSEKEKLKEFFESNNNVYNYFVRC
jgi:hypothetical protein